MEMKPLSAIDFKSWLITAMILKTKILLGICANVNTQTHARPPACTQYKALQ